METILLVDSSSLIYSAFFRYGIYNYKQQPIAVIFGFIQRVIKLADKYNTNNFIFCFDSKRNLRKKFYPEYKQQRNNKSDEDILLAKLRKKQETKLKFELMKIGFKNVFYKPGYEADDLLAYLAEKLKSKNVIMVTNDKDMFQCLDYCDLLNPKDKKHYSRSKFIKEYNLFPDQWPLAKAIGGCDSDNIKGIKGVSDPKSPTSKAIKYINGELKKGVVYNRIISEEGQNIIQRNLKLTKCPYKNKDFKLNILQNDITRFSFMKFINRYQFYKLLDDGKWKKLIND
ncbi:MAG: hypothetical protein BV456_06465 [Thermoplasmata archaeon M8B2D]|nr:MAG: hypothetical protein BV456_06465 [Thermoplasmata archaeon M8B2D]